MSNGNFTNGSLVLRLWRFDGGTEMMGKFAYYDDAKLFAKILMDRDLERSDGTPKAYFYLAVCDYECSAKAFGAKIVEGQP